MKEGKFNDFISIFIPSTFYHVVVETGNHLSRSRRDIESSMIGCGDFWTLIQNVMPLPRFRMSKFNKEAPEVIFFLFLWKKRAE